MKLVNPLHNFVGARLASNRNDRHYCNRGNDATDQPKRFI